MGQVCARHNEYYEDRCRWCEAPETDAGFSIGRDSFMFWKATPPPAFGQSLADHISKNNALLRHLKAKAYDERLRLAMTPPNDGHGIFE